MNVNDLRIGDIIVAEINEVSGGDYPKFHVVGSTPVVDGDFVKFREVLKKNGRDEFFLSTRVTSIPISNNELLVAAVNPDCNCWDEYFDVDSDDNWCDNMDSYLEKAKDKSDWIAPDEASDNPVMLQNPIVLDDVQAEEPQPVIRTSRFIIVCNHNNNINMIDEINDAIEGVVESYTITEIQ